MRQAMRLGFVYARLSKPLKVGVVRSIPLARVISHDWRITIIQVLKLRI